ncbi:hypothetical protein [Sporosarcina sp.]|uniref:hypothetical protein n=1 Tax=Sporosarcina sp. TaxID=49982 RepID=UPI00260F8EA9|nr:hypothetical protein [Sporosarcina sp.]
MAELYTSNSEDRGSKREWIGEYELFIQNTVPQQTSSICGKGGSLSAADRKSIMDEFELLKLPQQAGLGNFDYDYATKEEMDNIRYQLS